MGPENPYLGVLMQVLAGPPTFGEAPDGVYRDLIADNVVRSTRR